MEFIRNKKTGILEAWENGKKIGEIVTQGDTAIKQKKKAGEENGE